MRTTVINFVFESGFSLTIFTLVYLLFLRRETFFVLNRIYLLATVFFSILLPFVHFQVTSAMPSVMLSEVTVTAMRYQNLLQTVTVYGTKLTSAVEQTIQSIGLIRLVYLTGTAIFMVLFFYRLFQITNLIRNNEIEVKEGIRIVKIDRDTTPFSFFNYVFINRNDVNSQGMKEMLAHEMEHVRQRHSFDVIILEILTIFQWFNPFIWLLKRSIRENHEFLADHGVLKPGVSSAAYRLLLLGSSFEQQPVIANNFNYSLIKIRIKMMTKIKSSKIAAFKLSMGILVTAALLMIFAFDKDDSLLQDKKTTNKKAETTVNAQQKEKTADEQIFVQVEQMPEYPGGEAALRQFLASNVKYPDDAVKSGTQGKVFVKFVVNKDGKVVNPKIARSVSPSIDKEALRVVSIMPNWTPGKQSGKNVAVEYTVPIFFKLK
jgi:TonB family protein